MSMQEGGKGASSLKNKVKFGLILNTTKLEWSLEGHRHQGCTVTQVGAYLLHCRSHILIMLQEILRIKLNSLPIVCDLKTIQFVIDLF